jgi:Zn-dependent protease
VRLDDCLVQQVVINSGFRAPEKYNLETLRSCLSDSRLPDYLLGGDNDIWEDPLLHHDLIAVDLSKDEDSMTVWIAANLVAPFHQLVGRHFIRPLDDSAGLYDYSDRTITKLSSLVATVLSSVLPIGGVIVLYFVENTLARIGIIAGMTGLFSLCLALLTSARKSEIFAATAAFSAVLVVFLGSNN